MNIYKKYCPNVFVAVCEEKHEKGDEITITTKYGKENEHIVHNLVGYSGTQENPLFLYSITRKDGFTHQERAKRKAERLEGYAGNADKRSYEYYEKSNEHRGFLSLGEPIKIGHHSERRHRKIIDQAWNNMGKSVAESDKAKEYRRRAEYWKHKENDINLSMPESLDYYEFKLMEAKEKHKFYKENPDKREHSYSLTYANKAVKEMQKNVELAVKLWGNPEEVAQMDEEKKQAAEKKAAKTSKKKDAIKEYGGFFAFNTDQFKEGIQRIKEEGYLLEGEKVKHLMAGLYMPSKNIDNYLKTL
ncbi:MAG: DUF3560 domain-containing protein [Ignavibacteriae bacterium]|nr:DUF3560 domain-containing protein [Ignavibacteriota bacterium]